MQVSKIITAALKQLGVLAAGESASGEEYADCADVLHDLLSQWATHRLTVYKSVMLSLPLSGKGSYRIGRITDGYEDVYVCLCADYPELKYPLPDLTADISHISDTGWLDQQPISLVRDTNVTRDGVVTYQIDAPTWVFNVLSDAQQLKIRAFTLPQNLKVEDELNYPPEYERALKLSLAVEIAPMFGIEPTPTLLANQRAALDLLKRANSTPFYAKNDMLSIGRRGHCDGYY